MVKRASAPLCGTVVLVASCALAALASFPPDDILARARQAIGGEARLSAVTALSVKATAQTYSPLASRPLKGEVQIDILLPDKFLITRTWTSDSGLRQQAGGFNGDQLIEQARAWGGWWDVGFEKASKAAQAWQLAVRRRECTRYLLAWLLTAPAEYHIELAEAVGVEGAPAGTDILDAKGAEGPLARLFFARDTHRLSALTFTEPTAAAAATGESRAPAKGQPLFKSIESPEATSDETRLRFDDYRVEDGVLFPHTMQIEAGGLRDEWRVSRFRVNPPLDAADFVKR